MNPKTLKEGVCIKTIIRIFIVLTLIWVALNEPPQQAKADINKQAVPTTTTQQESVAEQSQPQATVVPAPAVPPAPSYPKGCENYVALVQKYDWNTTVAINVMRAESGCNPSAVGDTRPINGLLAPSCGLFQVRTLKGRPSCEELKNPAVNVEWAYRLFKGGGWRHWSVCKTRVSCY